MNSLKTLTHETTAGDTTRHTSPVQSPSKTLLRFFGRYADCYLRRHFHSARVLQNGLPDECKGLPLVIYLNHSSWWDPLLCLHLADRFFAERTSFAPIEASALARYRLLSRLGLFGLETGSLQGAARFLDTADAVLASPENVLWMTPQGKFVDPHARPLRFRSGLSHVARRVERAAFLPLAIEYSFWEERLPEILLSFGQPLIFGPQNHLSIGETTRLFETAMASLQAELSAAAQRRDPGEWRLLLTGRSGVGGIYDLWRRARAKFRGEKFSAAHSGL